jgi:HSP20 family molecular chaperone IbpA
MSLNRDINRLFDDLLQPSALPTMADPAVATALITPQINVSEIDTEIRVAAEFPGVDLDDLEVDVMDDMLVIRGEKRLERSDEDENYHFVECAYGSFQRTVQLPFAADPDQVQASFENGVLSCRRSSGVASEHPVQQSGVSGAIAQLQISSPSFSDSVRNAPEHAQGVNRDGTVVLNDRWRETH